MKFSNGDRAEIHSTSVSELNGITGTILGVTAFHAEMAFYIVKLDKRYPKSEWDAIALTEHCLNKI